MNLIQYIPQALRTEKPLPTQIDRLGHAALGMDTETGELNTVIKRVALYGKPLDATDDKGVTLRQHAGEEIGDAAWYVAIAVDALGLDPRQITPVTHAVVYPLDQLALEIAAASGRMADVVVYAHKQGRKEASPMERTYIANSLANFTRLLNSACVALGLDLGTLLDANIAKLQARFPDAYSNEAAEARADKGGLDARNS